MYEKHFTDKETGVVEAVRESHHSSSDEDQPLQWSLEEEKRLVRKVDLFLMPILMLAFFALQLDRGNIGNALTDFFFQDVGITQFQFNVGQQLLSLGIVLFEIPSNIVLYRLGPSIWIGVQIVAWGLVATFQAFQKGLGSYLATRLLLGICESGFIPAGLFTLTRWYTRPETSKRFSWFFVGNMTAGASSGLIAYGILHMRGICGLSGWQWLFILEGIFTVLVGFLFIALFPKSTSNPVSLLGFRIFNEREAQILTARVIREDRTKIHARNHVSWLELKTTLTNWRLLPHVIMTICGIAPMSALSSYGPTFVVSFGFGRLQSNAMTSIGAWCLLVTNLLWGYLADKWGKRGPLVFIGILIYTGLVIGNRVAVNSSNGNMKFAILTLVTAFSTQWHPVNGSWLALNAQSAGERSITMAILIMSANASGIVGSQLFQQGDAPKYQTGWSAILGLVAVAVVCSAIANVQYWLLNRRDAKRGLKELKYKP